MSWMFKIRRAYRRFRKYPWNTTSFSRKAEHGNIITDVFEKIRRMPGWFNVDDCAHFTLILEMQSRFGLVGDIFEIGSYFEGLETPNLEVLLEYLSIGLACLVLGGLTLYFILRGSGTKKDPIGFEGWVENKEDQVEEDS